MTISLKRVATFTAIGIATVVLLFVLVVEIRWDRKFPSTATTIAASRDSLVIARGRYLVYGPAHCENCHVAPEDQPRFAVGESPPLSGASTSASRRAFSTRPISPPTRRPGSGGAPTRSW